jgi:DNA-directed RNA polymerase subunit M/transcription elongation factor TFIIS
MVSAKVAQTNIKKTSEKSSKKSSEKTNEKPIKNNKKKLDKEITHTDDISEMSEDLQNIEKGSEVGFTLDTFNVKEADKIDIASYNFVTEQSKSFTTELIREAEKLIKRYDTIGKLNLILMNHDVSTTIEHSIFEFSLVHITSNNLANKFVTATYYDKLYDLMTNIEDSNHIGNLTLKSLLMSGKINPVWIAFMPPDQLYPANWQSILDKRERITRAENNMATTDLYKCKKCGERKMQVTEFQTRSADESSTKFATCCVCYATFTM